MGRRRQARENALHSLYLVESGLREDAAFRSINSEVDDDATLEFTRRLFKGTLLHRESLDRRISEIAVNWDVKRMAAVDRNVLRMAAFELIHCPDTPPSVVINEALEIVKKYSTEDSVRFVNGILDRVKEEWLEPPAP